MGRGVNKSRRENSMLRAEADAKPNKGGNSDGITSPDRAPCPWRAGVRVVEMLVRRQGKASPKGLIGQGEDSAASLTRRAPPIFPWTCVSTFGDFALNFV